MPLMKIDLREGHDENYINTLLDVAYAAQQKNFHTPDGDRYQVVNEHKDYQMKVGDAGLGFKRTKDTIVFSIISRPRERADKEAFYAQLASELQAKLGLNPDDLVVSIVNNDSEDWSFGQGKAQFINGDL
ncbi:tautomerase family protein [Eupransor demetentiae]|uniref:4-oxalocrotonate tautomerase family (PptA) n=1 Tax=Eupransor demetentiae TaxID=3109584 RepID=A0ABM9N6L4_9LACO|nr:4-oxalocrotonate tautomerase family (PptA) [Lactobacillaceae bacterium LMG 33000]